METARTNGATGTAARTTITDNRTAQPTQQAGQWSNRQLEQQNSRQQTTEQWNNRNRQQRQNNSKNQAGTIEQTEQPGTTEQWNNRATDNGTRTTQQQR
jgi:hypothetical protein